jgi:prepilin-type N-terminal cleavage/methylation domain-containing protein
MYPSKGFTLVEMLICLAIVGIIVAVVFPGATIKKNGPIYLIEPPPTEIRCVEGMKFIVQRTTGNLTQIFSNKGEGMPCKE